MVGRKRAAEESPTEKRETRSAKVPKTESRKSTKGTGRKGGSKLKTSMGAATFKSRAESLYVNLTHTVPSADVEASEKDPGFMAAIELVTTSFSTGSFGWKGNKRMTVTLPQREGEEEAEKLHISLSINATVIGSKDAKDEGEEGEQAGEKEAEGEDEPAQEGAPPAPAEEAEGTEKVSS
ncbi:uncharacterized protein EDB91DRAFT_1197557 [Suillus paluster]|uniref:uncharacterized protein n=1 Tax=Suillus paluster TaxID=48578 RepID=UPI001B8672A5|nr:uncharacterized protein EDB91DRAFT_1197557 [Suillus paluster]KAG1748910.1 hypothetical protein EDB91DRAFT_1197557 [Suillus paluster]